MKEAQEARRSHELGQITVLMVFAVIALFGAAALSIDGGFLYLQRRAAQSAADTAAMTGALAITKEFSRSDIEAIVLESITGNGFDNSTKDVVVQVHWPPVAPNAYAGNSEFIQVIVTSRIPLTFTPLVYQGSMEVTVEAVAHARINRELLAGYGLYGANESACKTVWFTGNPEVEVTGGGDIGSNSDAGCGCGSIVTGGNVEVNVFGGNITIADSGCWVSNGGSGDVSAEPISTAQEDKDKLAELVPSPDCSGENLGAKNINGEETLLPGVYESLKFRSNSNVTMTSGLYCITGGGQWGVETKGGAHIEGDGVTIYLMEEAGGWKSAGNSEVYLNAPTESDNPWTGMVIYAHPDNTNDIILTGTSNSLYKGTILGLGAHCDVEGNGEVRFEGQVICDTIRVNGTGELGLFYDAGNNYHIPDAIDLSQ